MKNQDQIDYWNSEAGDKWVQYAAEIDELLSPFLDAVIAIVDLRSGEYVLDVGCGGGTLSIAARNAVGSEGSVTGIDISKPLIALALRRTESLSSKISFELTDASGYQNDQAFDALISRFGVMFFDNPTEAFSNLRKAIKLGGRLAFACWQPLADNDWARVPLEVAMPLLPELPEMPSPDAPGPFAFAEPKRVNTILLDAGWRDVGVTPFQTMVSLPGNTIQEAAEFMLKMGPLGRLMEMPGVDKSAVLNALKERFETHQSEDGKVTLLGSAWLVTAHN